MASECGLGSCRPSWLGRFATFHSFLAVYGLLGTVQTMAFIYFVATLTTLEKRFKIPSRTTGIVMSGNEVSQILLSLYLSYHGGRANRPVWIAVGVAVSGLSCFILALPHLMYGAGEDALSLTVEHLDISKLINSTHNTEEVTALCSDRQLTEKCDAEEYSLVPVITIFISQFVLGIGTTLYFALGQTYLDDNTKKVQTPMLLGLVMSLRSFGPVVGFLLGFGCLSLYIDPRLTPVIDKKDPRWLGAWWLGWIILGLAMLLFAFLIALFPRRLPPRNRGKTMHKAQRNKSVQGKVAEARVKERQPLTKYMLDDFLPSSKSEEPEKFVPDLPPKPLLKMSKDTFMKALVRLLKNKLLMLNNVSAVFYILGASGYITFLTKYMETQFQKSAAGANIFAGVAGILAMVAGFLISGLFISRCKPAPRKLLAWNVLIGIVYVLGEMSLIWVGCPDLGIQGAVISNGRLEPQTACNTGCNCNLKYSPVCHEERQHTYFSACHAGCAVGSLGANSSTQTFTNCSCLAEPRPDYSLSNPYLEQPIEEETDFIGTGLDLGVLPSSKTENSTQTETSTENLSSFVLNLTSTSESPGSGNFSELSLNLSKVSSLAIDLPSTLETKTEIQYTIPIELSSSGESTSLSDEPWTSTPGSNYTSLMLGLVQGPEFATVTAGPCLVDCARSFLWFIIITCFMHVLGSSGRIGNILVNYRCVSPEDKPIAQGLGLLTISLFALIPGPIFYGAIIDSTCLVWNDSCSERGNCWLYHKEDFRYYINITAVSFTAIATFFDALVWYYGKTLNLYGEPEEDTTVENQF